MSIRFPRRAVARLLLCPLTALLMAAVPSDKGEKPGCDQIPSCRRLKAGGLESQRAGHLATAREQLQAAYELSQDYRLQATLGRVLQMLGRGDEAFAAFHLFLQASAYGDPQRAVVETWLRELIEQSPPEEPESPPVAAPSPPVLPCAPQRRPLARRVSGGALISLGLLGLVPSAVLASWQDRPAEGLCGFDGVLSGCVFDLRPAFAAGFALSAAALATGTLVLAFSAKKERGEQLPCRAP